jgi:O-antigen/teichoic acid export membrane protein
VPIERFFVSFMASPLKKLLGQTAIYGLPSIIGRFLNYLLTPLFTNKDVFLPEQYGVITEMYAYVAFLVVLLTYGLETAFFRFYSQSGEKKAQVYSTALWSVVITSFGFIALASVFAQPIADFLGYPNHKEYITWFAIIVGLDALIAIPLAKLRADNKSIKFSIVHISSIVVNIGLNLFFLAYCLPKYQAGDINWLVQTFYNPDIGVGYVFIANLIASVSRFLIMLPDIFRTSFKIDKSLWKQMMIYALPLLFAGLAGIINETLDRALLKWILWPSLGEKATMTQLGIYGACYKLSIVITLFIQAYRYAAEPFFFDQQRSGGAPKTYASMLHVFFAFVMLAFLGVTLFIDIFKYFIPNEVYWVGLDIVPILLLANVFLGVYYNLSAWYKLTDKTIYGAYIAIGGAALTIALNVILIPILGFRGSACATLACYFSMATVSYYFGQRFFPVPYNIPKLLGYFLLAFGFFLLDHFFIETNSIIGWVAKSIMTLTFMSTAIYLEVILPKRKNHAH